MCDVLIFCLAASRVLVIRLSVPPPDHRALFAHIYTICGICKIFSVCHTMVRTLVVCPRLQSMLLARSNSSLARPHLAGAPHTSVYWVSGSLMYVCCVYFAGRYSFRFSLFKEVPLFPMYIYTCKTILCILPYLSLSTYISKYIVPCHTAEKRALSPQRRVPDRSSPRLMVLSAHRTTVLWYVAKQRRCRRSTETP